MLERAVRSVLSQSMRDFELIVVDDGSTESLEPVISLVHEAGHRFIRTEHRGVSSARNTGVENARFNLIAFLDSDDEWLPRKLSRQVQFHTEHEECRISQTDEIWIRNGRRVNKKKYHQLASGNAFELCVERCAISPSSVMLARKLLEEAGGFDEDMPACEDFDLWLRIAYREEIGLLEELLIRKYGGHLDQLSRITPALDHWRVYSLLKVLIHENLTEPQQQLVSEALHSKVGLLLKGAAKHAPHQLELYRKIIPTITRIVSNSEDDSTSLIQELLDSASKIRGKEIDFDLLNPQQYVVT